MWTGPDAKGFSLLAVVHRRCGLLCMYFRTRVSESHEPRKLPVAATFVLHVEQKVEKNAKGIEKNSTLSTRSLAHTHPYTPYPLIVYIYLARKLLKHTI